MARKAPQQDVIFKRVVEPPQHWNPNTKEGWNGFTAWLARFKPVREQLADIRTAANHILAEYEVSTDTSLQDRDGIPGAARDALEILAVMDDIDALPDEQLDAVILGWKLGQAALRANIRQAGWEQLAGTGKTIVQSASLGGRVSRKLTDAKKAAAKAERDQLIRHGHTLNDACRTVAPKYNVSYKTIERLK